ncbi:MAG TPA: hypothetical protein VK636_15900 [Gemmatimonadaceae bacterium]|nr:hypothetical protein [Gemmatimonadaceae bacterium]
MNKYFGWLGTIAVAAGATLAPSARTEAQQAGAATASPCHADSNYQRLAFWVGDWEVVDSTGAHYATQRVRAVVDACAMTAEWTGRVGDKGLSMSGFDARAGEWRQIYVSNQIPFPSGAPVRKSDPSYRGPGVRFIPLVEPADGSLARSRVTILPLSDHRAMQLFEDSSDGGTTWHAVFKAEHRPQPAGAP